MLELRKVEKLITGYEVVYEIETKNPEKILNKFETVGDYETVQEFNKILFVADIYDLREKETIEDRLILIKEDLQDIINNY